MKNILFFDENGNWKAGDFEQVPVLVQQGEASDRSLNKSKPFDQFDTEFDLSWFQLDSKYELDRGLVFIYVPKIFKNTILIRIV